MPNTAPSTSFDPSAVLENVTVPVIVVDKQWLSIYVNAAAERIIGRSRGAILGKRLFDVFPAAVGTPIEATYRRAMTEQIPITFEAFYEPAATWVEMKLFPSPETLTIFLSDISERKVAADALRQSEASLAEAQRIAQVGSWEWDVTSDSALWSDETFRIFGLAPVRLGHHQQNFLELVVPADRDRVAAALRDAVAGVRDYRLDYRIRLDGGAEKWIHAEGELERSADGHSVIMRGTVQDITQRKRTEESLRETQSKLLATFRVCPAAIAITRIADGMTLEANDAILRILGFTREEFIGHTTIELDLWPDLADRRRVVEQLYAVGAVSDMEVRLRTRAGRQIVAQFSAVRIDYAGEACLMGSFVDITERKAAEESLRQSHERFAQLSASTFEGISISENGVLVDVNDQFAAMFGYEPRELMGLEIEHLIVAEERAGCAKYLRTGGQGPVVCTVLRKDGERFRVEIRVRTTTWRGRAAHITVFHDITARENAERALVESELRYRSIFENSIAGIYRVDLDGTNLTVNPSLAALFGFASPEEMHASIKDVGNQLYADPERREELWRLLRTQGRAENFEIHAKRRDGTLIWVLLNADVVRDSTGKIICSQGYNIDITQWKRDQEALRQSEAEYRSIFENSLVGMLESGPDNCIRRVNDAFCRMVEYSRHELLGVKAFEQLTHPEDLAATQHLVAKLASRETASFMIEKRYITKSGRVVHAIVHSRAEYDAYGLLAKSTTSVMDITPRKMVEEELRAHQERLRRLAAELTLIQARERRELAGLLHDSVTQDLAMARLQLQMLKGPPFPADAADLVDKSRELVERAIARSRSLTLELSPPALYEIGLKAALSGLVEELRKVHPVEIELVMSRARLPLDEPRKVLLYRALRELLLNIVKHAGAAHATLTIVVGRRKLTATVADDGVGFDPGATQAPTGYGLFSVREQLEGLGGKLEIVSTPGKGTQVTIVLPIDPSTPAPSETPHED